jgi:hypothetical protein
VTRYETFISGTEPTEECYEHGAGGEDGWWIF